MELKPGYKRTDVGVIPEEWEVTNVETLGSAGTPVIKAGPFGSALKKEMYVSRGYKIYGQEQVIRDDPAYGDYFISAAKYKELQSCAVRPGDVLLSLVGTAGKLMLMPEGAHPGIINPRLIRLSFDRNRVCPAFFKRLFEANGVQSSLDRVAQGGTMGILNTSMLRSIQIPLPRLREQEAIATALSDVDALLTQLDRLIAKKRDIKQAAMQQLLTGKTRLPGFGGEWSTRRLGDVGTCLRGVSYQGAADLFDHDTDHSLRLLRANNVQSARIVTDDLQFVRSDRASDQQRLRRNDVLICMANGSKALVGKAALFAVADGHTYTFGAFMACFRVSHKESNPAFVFNLFQTGRYRDYISNLLAGSSINNLTPGSIESLEFLMPEVAEQTAIATLLSDLDAELAALEARRDKTRALKQGMMQELLTGRTQLI